MTDWSLHIDPKAEEDLYALEQDTRLRIIDKLEWLAENFDKIHPRALTGKYSGYYKLRVGDYRVIYTTRNDRQALYVIAIGHRSDIYE